jgi:hypothetical protein
VVRAHAGEPNKERKLKMAHEAGKGSKPRPFSVSQKEYDTRWDAIFSRDGLDDNDKKEVDTSQDSQYNNDTEKQ